jgi:Dual specificity phosphatase, catalytic domain
VVYLTFNWQDHES